MSAPWARINNFDFHGQQGLTARELQIIEEWLNANDYTLAYNEAGQLLNIYPIDNGNWVPASLENMVGEEAEALMEVIEAQFGEQMIFSAEDGGLIGMQTVADGTTWAFTAEGGLVEAELVGGVTSAGEVIAEGGVAAGVAIEGGAAAGVAVEAGTEAVVGVAGIEAGEITGALAAEGAVAAVLGPVAVVTGVAIVAAGIILGALCIFHVLNVCKKKVCRDPRGRWHSHSSHCIASNGCYDKNGLWHRHQKHCTNQVCQGPDGTWHHNEHHCKHHGCTNPNGEFQMPGLSRPLVRNCQSTTPFQNTIDQLRRHKHHKHCDGKRDLIAERDAAFARPDLLSIDNSYIVITNAASFQPTELDVLREMVIMPDEDPALNFAHFESGEAFSEEGTLTQVEHSTDVWTGNFTFPFPGSEKTVEGKWLSVDPASKDEKAQQILGEIKTVHEKAAALRQ